MRDLSERQSQLFFLINSFITNYQPAELQSLIDDDVAEAVEALAATYETSVRGVIYDHRPASLPADRLATALRPVLAEAGKNLGTAFERDAAVVLRRVSPKPSAKCDRSPRREQGGEADNRKAFVDLLGRVIKRPRSGIIKVLHMAKHCEICGKTPVVGRQHSHAQQRERAAL